MTKVGDINGTKIKGTKILLIVSAQAESKLNTAGLLSEKGVHAHFAG